MAHYGLISMFLVCQADWLYYERRFFSRFCSSHHHHLFFLLLYYYSFLPCLIPKTSYYYIVHYYIFFHHPPPPWGSQLSCLIGSWLCFAMACRLVGSQPPQFACNPKSKKRFVGRLALSARLFRTHLKSVLIDFDPVLVSYNKLEDESRHTTFCGCFRRIIHAT